MNGTCFHPLDLTVHPPTRRRNRPYLVSDPCTLELCILYDNDVTAKFNGRDMVMARVRVRAGILVRVSLRLGYGLRLALQFVS